MGTARWKGDAGNPKPVPLKHLPRQAEARTIDAVTAAIGKLLEGFPQQECTTSKTPDTI